MIYLCSVYSLNADAVLMEKRYEYAMKRTAEFLREGYPVFSPIAHCHELAVRHDLPKSFDFWRELDFKYISACEEVWVLKMPGYEQSVGVNAEIQEALKQGKTVVYFKCDDYIELESDPASVVVEKGG